MILQQMIIKWTMIIILKVHASGYYKITDQML